MTATIAPEERGKHVVVVGGGVVGVVTAYMLALRGPEVARVTLLEADDLARATSFANAGRFCPVTLLKGPPASPDGISAAFRTLLPLSWLTGCDNKAASAASLPGIVHYAKQASLTPGLAGWGLW